MRTKSYRGKIAGACGIIAPVILLLSILAAIFYAPWFSWTDNALSDLGVSGMPAYLFNGSLAVSGFLMLIFGTGLYMNFPDRIPKAGSILFILSSAMLSGVGVFTLDTRFLHILCAGSFFILSAVAIILIGIWEMKNRKQGKIPIALGILSGIMWIIPWGAGIAINEITSALFICLFSVIHGKELLKVHLKR